MPGNFKLHPRVEKLIADRRAMGEGKQPLDWGMGEILAYASLVDQDYGVRLSGEDVGRGTFSHRHAVLHDQNREKWDAGTWVPLQHIKDGQPDFEVIDSVLTENAVLGFEYGYSTSEPYAARDLGSPVRRLRQRRTGRDRPVHQRRRSEVGPDLRSRAVPAARLRRPGSRAFVGASRALPAAVRAAQHAGRACRRRRRRSSTCCAGR